MKLLKLFLITILAFAIGACGGAATEQKKDDAKDATKNEEKKDETKKAESTPADSGKVADSPKVAVENFVAAVKAKDEAGIRAALSADTIKGFDMMAKETKKSFFEALTDGREDEMNKMPEMKDVKIDGDKASAELKAKEEKNWTKINFVKEGGSWKMALISTEQMKKMEKDMEDAKKSIEASKTLTDDKKSDK